MVANFSMSWEGITWQSPPLSGSTTSLNSLFFFYTGCNTKVKEPFLLYNLPTAGKRIVGFIPFPQVLALVKFRQLYSGYELRKLSPIPLMITVMPQVLCTSICQCYLSKIFSLYLEWGAVSYYVVSDLVKYFWHSSVL